MTAAAADDVGAGVCSTDEVLDSESRRTVDRRGDESASRFSLASFLTFCTGVEVLERRAAGVNLAAGSAWLFVEEAGDD